MPNENIKKNQTISGRKVVWAVLSAVVVGAVGGKYSYFSFFSNIILFSN